MSLRTFLDTSCFIYFFEPHPKYGPKVKDLFHRVNSDQPAFSSSIISYAEVLIKPIRDKNEKLFKAYQEFFDPSSGRIILYAPDKTTALEAALIRSSYNFHLIDSFQLALAKQTNCTLFLTNDIHLKKYREVEVKLLSEL